MNKKENERNCLENAIKIGLNQKGQTKKLVKHISGDYFTREDEERPDFVKYCPPNNKNERGTLIGIEHFRVDHFSWKKKNGKIASTGAIREKKASDLFVNWHDEVLKTKTIPDDVIKDIMDITVFEMDLAEKATYKNFISSFRYSLIKHIDMVDVYYDNIRKLAKSKYNVEMCFLIEIHSDFRHLFTVDSKGTRRILNGQMPMFADIVRILEREIDTHKVDFIIFYLINDVQPKNEKVIAVPTNNLWSQLEKHNIRIYEYAGSDLFLDEFQALHDDINIQSDYSRQNGNINFHYSMNMSHLSEDVQMQLNLRSYKKAIDYLSRGCNIVTTYGTQMLIDCFSGCVLGWQEILDQGQVKVDPILMPMDIQFYFNRLNDFSNKWEIKKGND